MVLYNYVRLDFLSQYNYISIQFYCVDKETE